MSVYVLIIMFLLLFTISFFKTKNDVKIINKLIISFVSSSIFVNMLYLFYFMYNDSVLLITVLMILIVITAILFMILIKVSDEPRKMTKQVVVNIYYATLITVSIFESFVFVVDRYYAILIYFQIPVIIILSVSIYFIQKWIISIVNKNTDYMIKYLIGISIGLTIFGYNDVLRETTYIDKISVVNVDNRIDYYEGVDLDSMFDDVTKSNATIFYQPAYIYSNVRALSVLFILLSVSLVKTDLKGNKKHT
ncbi:hypothetical protein CI105_08720 [Candidatus Izimaplasma bacterium ZiA1]|uniref:hypothetical protein n=1 Tax=Candidatus Izimoplasma sp. ZiA1 TaxID=2024899 RepID=UPI000BAA54A0|nr:hypothetical protein CI105_08720 [Candidatus Izimaplasma bacterium ZiA1]